jgi:hypothetical protein
MKPNVNHNGPARKSLGTFGLIGIVALAFCAGAYSNYSEFNRKIAASQQDAVVLDKLVEASRLNMLLRALNTGRTEEAKHFLKVTLAEDLMAMNTLSNSAKSPATDQAKATLAQFARDMKKHPDYYLSSKLIAGTNQTASIQVAKK